MATGKTHARFLKVLLDDKSPTAVDITASVDTISPIGLQYDEAEVTAYSDGVKNFVLGHPSADIELSGPFNNTADTGAHHVFVDATDGILGNMAATNTLTIQIGIRAAATTGDPEWEGEYYASSYRVDGDRWSGRLVPASATAPAWGTVS